MAEGDRRGEVRFFGDVASSPAAVAALIRKLAKAGRTLSFCYEAGPTGYELHRQIVAAGHDCAVVAPSLITKRPATGWLETRTRTEHPSRFSRATRLETRRCRADVEKAPIGLGR